MESEKRPMEAAKVQLSPYQSIGVLALERGTDPVREKRPTESKGVHMSLSSRISRDKPKSEAGGCYKS